MHTCPNGTFCASQVAQAAPQAFSRENIGLLNHSLRRVIDFSADGLRYAENAKKDLEMGVYADVSFTCNDDLSSQIRYVTLLCDRSGN